MEGEIRQDKVTKQWVIYAPSRSKRPRELRQPASAQQAEPAYDSNCPFCAGNEQLLETLILELPHPHQPGWLTRVVRNKFPALHPAASTIRCSADMYVMMPGFGYHEVVIESPYHNQQLSGMSREEIGVIIETYHRRYTALAQDARVMLILIFRNHGTRAGASLAHPHAQIIATGMVPNHCRWREDEAQRYFDQWGRCVYCDILRFEEEDRRRVVFENDSFLAFIPYAPRFHLRCGSCQRRTAPILGRSPTGSKPILPMPCTTFYNGSTRGCATLTTITSSTARRATGLAIRSCTGTWRFGHGSSHRPGSKSARAFASIHRCRKLMRPF